MKNLYITNKWLVIINAFLFIIPALGLTFLIVLGIIQLGMYLIMVAKYNNLGKSGKTQFIIYSLFTYLVLALMILLYSDKIHFEKAFCIGAIIIGILLSFLNLNITYLLFKNDTK